MASQVILDTTSNATLRWTLYRREILNYISTMTIKFTPFHELMIKRARERLGDLFVMETYRDSPYYKNLVGEYSILDTPMYVWSLEEQREVLFNRQLWIDYPATAGMYTFGSDNYVWLCKKYPNQVGLIKNICYPVPSIDEAYEAEEFTILRHEPDFLKPNEQDALYAATKKIIEYVCYRWYVKDYEVEDQYPLVFISQLYLHLFQGLLKARMENQDTYAVHQLHVWDRLESNGLLPYEGILSDSQARWFYKNMRYLKENRGKKSNLILLADNLLQNLRVHLVGKRIFQNTTDYTNDCVLVPEFLSDDVVDYSTKRVTTITTDHARISEDEFMGAYTGPANSSIGLVDLNKQESMDHILARVHEEGYYPKYGYQDSLDMQERFGKTITNNVPTRLLELVKYVIHTPYARIMAAFCFDTLMYQCYLGHLSYKIAFEDPNTGVIVNLKASDAIALLNFCMYRIFNPDEVSIAKAPICLPQFVDVHRAYLTLRPRDNDLPKTYYWNKFKYNIDTIIKNLKVLDEIPWLGNKIFYTAETFVKAIGKQYRVRVKHMRELFMEMHPAHQWAMCFYYQHLEVHSRLQLREKCIRYDEWIASTEGVSSLISAYDELIDYRDYYDQLSTILMAKLLPIEASEDLAAYVGAIFDSTEYYVQLKRLFQDWTGHYLTYLDTERDNLTYLELQPTTVCTGEHGYVANTQINVPGATCVETYMVEEEEIDLKTYESIPYLISITHEETTTTSHDVSVEVDLGHVEECNQKKLNNSTVIVNGTFEQRNPSNIYLRCGCDLIGASIPEGE